MMTGFAKLGNEVYIDLCIATTVSGLYWRMNTWWYVIELVVTVVVAEDGWEWANEAETDFQAWKKKKNDCAAVKRGKENVQWFTTKCSSGKKIICVVDK